MQKDMVNEYTARDEIDRGMMMLIKLIVLSACEIAPVTLIVTCTSHHAGSAVSYVSPHHCKVVIDVLWLA